ncbi:MAG: HAMP domain-containing protein [Alphaproteobacteria bacterium TMED89]|nr:two-component sensor histidine kinase [Rhodospirillaceae bacterium]RPH16723.1 MAG: HAMP domain-containing protein [Alphaproteobacteria bacterium TMED89]
MSDASLTPLVLASEDHQRSSEGQGDADVPNIGRNRTLTLFVGALTVVSLLVLAWTGFELWRGFSPTRPLGRIVSLLWFDLILLVALATFITVQGFYAWVDIRDRLSGTQVYRRVVLFLVVVASLPTFLISLVAVLVLGFGIQTWFGGAVSDAVNSSREVAQAYLGEHRSRLNFQASRVADDIEGLNELASNLSAVQQVIYKSAGVRRLSGASVIRRDGTIVTSAQGLSEEDVLDIPSDAFDLADELRPQGNRVDNRGVEISLPDDDVLSMLISIENAFLTDTYLVASVNVDDEVVERVKLSNEASNRYSNMSRAAEQYRLIFALLFFVVALLLVILAGMAGLRFALWLTTPILELTRAADRLGSGDLSTRVTVADETRGDELSTLSRTFNGMANQIEAQQVALLQATDEADLRRRFSEAVLSGVSRGVIGLDSEMKVNLPNRRANRLFDLDLEDSIGKPLSALLPMFDDLLAMAKSEPAAIHTGDVLYTRPDGKVRTLETAVVAEMQGESVLGYVLTFDDITDFLAAQRQAAWSDVARRIAHEIKNPLTPIQLSAERLKRRYLKQIDDRPDIFETCTDTIIGQVADIARMVDEFSSFARMPAPRVDDHDLVDIARRVISLQGSAFEGVRLEDQTGVGPVRVNCDMQLVSQSLINLIKNAAEALQAVIIDGELQEGLIRVSLQQTQNGSTVVTVNDNGQGYPPDLLPQLAEPYVTTREKGTGLGLAIVKKIMEDHGGQLVLSNADHPDELPGAKAQMIFPPASISAPPPGDSP